MRGKKTSSTGKRIASSGTKKKTTGKRVGKSKACKACNQLNRRVK